MTVYLFDLLVGYEPNGVDRSQANRARIFKKTNLDVRYIFSVLPPREDFLYFQHIGIPLDKMMIAPFYLAGEKGVQSTITIEEMISRLHLENSTIVQRDQHQIVYQLSEDHRLFLKCEDGIVYQVDHFYQDTLYQRDHYTSHLICREWFDQGTYQWSKRCFYNSESEVVYEGFQSLGKTRYRFGSEWLEGEYDLMQYFIKSLSLSSADVVLMDRVSRFSFSQAILEYGNNAKIGVFLHSLHQYKTGAMNNEYHYLFQHATSFDFMLVSTEAQKTDLENYLREMGLPSCPICVIPAASIESLESNVETMVPYSAMLAARLNYRKQVDIAIKVGAKVKEKIPGFTLDIYGQGEDYHKLNQLISELNAEEYIRLRGYQNLKEEYKKHQLYLSTSSWETLGLTLLEGVASGMGLVGLDVPYGAPTFIQNGKNGYLVPYSEGQDKEESVERMTKAVLEFFDLNQNEVSQHSYRIATSYLDEVIAEKWRVLIED